ncbi:ABC transporter, permease protein [Mobiluncus mulieris ATCC 35239]|uniref:ABC transporter, permease protein n=2 Tax=Mobiluncus mulieris TaxID=2052 RepID=E0QQP6_9ACTO|nr:sugar ABC transporter permease [Mobiluncus mulieris]EFM45889.1 ABC transporter, permease protein [Mobiluncus mulieris ATCC 35239]MCU9971014.1 sugar ABC transporter permease [Mobiluncus mulieris]MCU9975233.1 sugar ABC transporter permease [Mobiluncus mulieris]MCU9993250.1 sugar ABC transporter permease [Mobiluncus mulieris]MCV0013691.1 sugar ABC transporter permease [Mobiluncus mulieris]
MTRQQAPARRHMSSASGKEQVITAYAMLIPALVILGIFVFYPIVAAAYMSLTSWDGFNPEMPFVGLDNYLNLAKNPEFWNSLTVTVIYAAGVSVLSVLTGLVFAILLDAPIRGRGLYRTIYFLPVVTSSVAVSIVWKYMLDDSGLVNNWLGHLGITGPDWLQNRWIALAALTLLTVWKNLGFNIVLYLTALQGLPRSVFEAAEIDGANKLQQIRFMTVPLLRPMTFFVVVQALINSFQAFDLVYVFTEGGPRGGTDVLGMMMYRQAFRLGNFGYGTAISLVTLVLVLVVTLVQWKFSGTEEK